MAYDSSGCDDVDELDLVELMHADHAARVLAGAAGLAAEAGRVGGVADGQLVGGEDFLAMEIGDRDFGGRHEIERGFFVYLIHVLGKFGELRGSDHAFRTDQKGSR